MKNEQLTLLFMSKLTEKDYRDLSLKYNLEVALIKAVEEVESNGNGYLDNGLLKILFEAHIFSRFTKHKYDKTNLSISSLFWNRSLYKGGIKEYLRLEEAYSLDLESALKSCSYGSFQIMGFNYKICGYNNVYEFVSDVRMGLLYGLNQFIKYCIGTNILIHLKSYKWNTFAKLYNGLGYLKNKYNIKLKNAYHKYKNAI